MIARRGVLIGTVVLARLADSAGAQGDTPYLVDRLAVPGSVARQRPALACHAGCDKWRLADWTPAETTSRKL